MKTVGILGYGSFGEFLVRKLNSKLTLKVYDPFQKVPAKYVATLAEIGSCDYVVLSVPVSSYESLLKELSPLLGREAVIVDIASVKTIPVALLDELLPNQNRVVMHPLFGPQSAEKSYWGHVVVMCPDVSDGHSYAEVKDFIIDQGLAVVEKTPEDHDKEMAFAQGLTFYLARALLTMGIHDIELITPSFRKLLDLAELESHHSEELFRTIQTGNPYLNKIRTQFIDVANKINSDLTE